MPFYQTSRRLVLMRKKSSSVKKHLKKRINCHSDHRRIRSVGAYEAKTHLSRLLAEVESGSQIQITRNGQTIALISRVTPSQEIPIADVIEQIRAARKEVRLGGEDIAELKKMGRR